MNDVEVHETWGAAHAFPSTEVVVNGWPIAGAKVMSIRKGAVAITVPTTTLRVSYGEAPPEEVEDR